MSETNIGPAPILVLGIGNSLMGDDGVGVRLVEECARACSHGNNMVEFLEGGTQGLALLGRIADRSTLILLDAVALGEEPGSIHYLLNEQVLELGGRAATAHEANAGELLKTASLLGDLPGTIVLVGVEPASIRTGIELSPAVKEAIPLAIEVALESVEDALVRLRAPAKCRKAAPRNS